MNIDHSLGFTAEQATQLRGLAASGDYGKVSEAFKVMLHIKNEDAAPPQFKPLISELQDIHRANWWKVHMETIGALAKDGWPGRVQTYFQQLEKDYVDSKFPELPAEFYIKKQRLLETANEIAVQLNTQNGLQVRFDRLAPDERGEPFPDWLKESALLGDIPTVRSFFMRYDKRSTWKAREGSEYVSEYIGSGNEMGVAKFKAATTVMEEREHLMRELCYRNSYKFHLRDAQQYANRPQMVDLEHALERARQVLSDQGRDPNEIKEECDRIKKAGEEVYHEIFRKFLGRAQDLFAKDPVQYALEIRQLLRKVDIAKNWAPILAEELEALEMLRNALAPDDYKYSVWVRMLHHHALRGNWSAFEKALKESQSFGYCTLELTPQVKEYLLDLENLCKANAGLELRELLSSLVTTVLYAGRSPWEEFHRNGGRGDPTQKFRELAEFMQENGVAPTSEQLAALRERLDLYQLCMVCNDGPEGKGEVVSERENEVLSLRQIILGEKY